MGIQEENFWGPYVFKSLFYPYIYTVLFFSLYVSLNSLAVNNRVSKK